MASLSDIQSFLRQRRAAGKPTSRREYESAYAGYFDAQNARRLQSSALSLDRDRLDLARTSNERNQDRADQSLAFQRDTSNQNLAMQREQMENAEDAAAIKGIVDIGTLGVKAADTELGKKAISKVGSLFSGSAAPSVATTAPAISTGAQGVIAGAIEPGTGLAATGAKEAAGAAAEGSLMGSVGTGLANAGLSVGAGLAADAVFGEKVEEAGDIASYATAGGLMFGLVGAVVGGVIGLGGEEIYETGKKAVDETFDFVNDAADEVGNFVESGWNKASDAVGTWLCTKTKDTAGFSKSEWRSLHIFREYAKQTHGNWLSFYVDVGPALLKRMGSDPRVFIRMKESFIMPVIRLTISGRLEAAYQVYKRVAIRLAERYAPHVLEAAPAGGVE